MKLIDKYFLSSHATEYFKDLALKTVSHLPTFLKKKIVSNHIQKQRENLKNLTSPTNLFYFVTNRCNLRCTHCFYQSELSNEKDKELNISEIIKFTKTITKPDLSVLLCGGEPFVRDDMEDIVLAFAENAGVSGVTITTNGMQYDKTIKFIENVTKKTNINLHIPISLDGLKDIHNKIRNNSNSFDNAVRLIKELEVINKTNENVKPIINSVISKDNIENYMDFYNYVRDTFTCNFAYTLVRQDAKDVVNLDKSLLLDPVLHNDLLPELDECEKLLDEIYKQEKFKNLIKLRNKIREYHLEIVRNKKPILPCVAPNMFLTLFPNGDTSLCEVTKPFGNIRDFDYDINKCWHSMQAENRRGDLDKCACTYPCALTSSIFLDEKSILDVLR